MSTPATAEEDGAGGEKVKRPRLYMAMKQQNDEKEEKSGGGGGSKGPGNKPGNRPNRPGFEGKKQEFLNKPTNKK